MWIFGALLPDPGLYAVAVCLFFAAGVVTWYALFGDRHRRQPLCRRCRYDMIGHTSLRCPECGYEHAGEYELFKPRRHPSLLWLGIGLVVFALLTAYYPHVRERRQRFDETRIAAWTPTTWRILSFSMASQAEAQVLAGRLEASSNTSVINLSAAPPTPAHQVNLEPLYTWQQALLAYQSESVLADPQQSFSHQQLAAGVLLAMAEHPLRSPSSVLVDAAKGKRPYAAQPALIHDFNQLAEVHPRVYADVLLHVLQGQDPVLQKLALQGLREHGQSGGPAIDRLVQMLPAHHPEYRPYDVTDLEREVCETLVSIGQAALPAVTEALPDETRRGGAVYVIDQLAPDNALAAPVLLRQYTVYTDERIGSYTFHWAPVVGRMGETATAACLDALWDDDPWVRLTAVESLREIYDIHDQDFWEPYPERRPDPRSDLAWRAISSLWELADRESEPVLRERAEHVARQLTQWRQDIYRLGS